MHTTPGILSVCHGGYALPNLMHFHGKTPGALALAGSSFAICWTVRKIREDLPGPPNKQVWVMVFLAASLSCKHLPLFLPDMFVLLSI